MTPVFPNLDEFSENFQRWGGGSFPIQQNSLQIFAIINGKVVMNFPKNRNIVFRNEGKGERVSQSFSENSSKFGNTGVPNFISGSLVTRVHAPQFCSFGSKLDNQ